MRQRQTQTGADWRRQTHIFLPEFRKQQLVDKRGRRQTQTYTDGHRWTQAVAGRHRQGQTDTDSCSSVH
eukprot:8949029-Lingulodinium_polyedra.AAC.1